MESVNQLVELWRHFDAMAWLQAHHGWQLYAALAVLVFLETFPFVGSVILIQPLLAAVGYWLHDGVLDPLWTLLAVVAGATLADQLGYGLGRGFGQRLLAWMERSEHLSERFVLRWRTRLQRYAFWVLLVAKYNPMTRTLTPILAGMVPVGWLRFSVYSTLASLIWAAFWLGIGFGVNRLWALQQWPSHHIWTLVAVGLLLFMLLGWWWRRDAVQRQQD